MKKLLVLMAFLSFLVVPAMAHDGSASVEFSGVGIEVALDVVHDPEDDPWKGFFTLTVKNTGTEAWGDFHFAINSGFGGDPTSVLFTDVSMGGVNPSSTQSPMTWTIGTNENGFSTLDLYFYDDPIGENEIATFIVYTDNTAENLSWFGMCIYPTPVPEPATLSILGLGGLALLRRKRS